MSIFGFYFVSGLLREAGWPRKKGLLNKAVLDTAILDAAIFQMIDWAACLGAERPMLALQAIAEIYRERDWNSDDVPEISKLINGLKAKDELWRATSGVVPRDVVRPTRFADAGPTLDAKALTDARARSALEKWFLLGLLWGFSNPEAFRSWYKLYASDLMDGLPAMRQAGLMVDVPADLPQLLAESEAILRRYERDIGPLPDIPAKLLADARALGRLPNGEVVKLKAPQDREGGWADGLRKLYATVMPEPMPDSFDELVTKLDREEQGKQGAPTDPSQPMSPAICPVEPKQDVDGPVPTTVPRRADVEDRACGVRIFLRWIAVLPASILGAVLSSVPLHFILYQTLTGSGLIEPYPELPERLLTPLAASLAFIWAGSRIAPSHKVETAVALFGALLLLLGGFIALGIVRAHTANVEFFLLLGGLPAVGGVAGAIIGLFVVWRENSGPDARAVVHGN